MHNPTYRVLKIFQVISENKSGYTLSELSKLTDIPFSTLSPIVKTMHEMKYLELNYETSRYTIGIQAYYVGASYITKNSALELVRKELEGLSQETHETCQMGVLEQDQIFYVLKIEGNDSIRVVSEVGGSLPAYSTALGKALLASESDEQLRLLFDQKELVSLTDNTITNKDELINELDKIRNSGFATEHGESNPSANCVALTIEKNGQAVAALSVAYPSFKESEEKVEQIKELLSKYKTNIEKVVMTHNLF